MKNKTKVGVIGCGNISSVYLNAAKQFDALDITCCSDRLPERAKALADEFGIRSTDSVEKMLGDPSIEIILNLTIPNAHYDVGMAAIEAGKHIYNEKPLSIDRKDGLALLAAANEKNLRVGCAPDTFLGGGIQTCLKLINDGDIGEPVAASAFLTGRGPERWHPDPEFFYKLGGGPLFDMGPYYLTTLISLLGPVSRVTGSARISFPERTILSEAKYGEKIKVETPTHIAGVMDFKCGAVGTIITSFDVWAANLPIIEIYGTEGTLSVPDPNGFSGPVRIKRAEDSEWSEVPLTHGFTEQSRSIGLADMAGAIRSNRKHRANGQMAYHVLDVMHSFLDASAKGMHVNIESDCERPEALHPDAFGRSI